MIYFLKFPLRKTVNLIKVQTKFKIYNKLLNINININININLRVLSDTIQNLYLR